MGRQNVEGMDSQSKKLDTFSCRSKGVSLSGLGNNNIVIYRLLEEAYSGFYPVIIVIVQIFFFLLWILIDQDLFSKTNIHKITKGQIRK